MKSYLSLVVSVTLLGMAAAAFWFWFRGESPALTAIADPTDQAQVTLGRRIYDRDCASCHGAKLEGQPNWQVRNEEGRLPAPPHDETGHTWHHPDAQLVELTAKGPAAFVGTDYQSDMPAFEGVLTESEIHAVLAYIKSRWPQEIRERQAEITKRAETQD